MAYSNEVCAVESIETVTLTDKKKQTCYEKLTAIFRAAGHP